MSFHEVQRAPRALRTLLFVVMGITGTVAAVVTVLQWQTDPEHSLSAIVLMVLLVVGVPTALVLWLLATRQEVTIDASGVTVHQRGIMLRPKHWAWSDITHTTLRPMSPFGEFGGWGVRYGLHGKWGYVLDGRHGIELTLQTGKPRVISVVDAQGAQQSIRLHAPEGIVSARSVTER